MKEAQIKSFFDELINAPEKAGEFGEIVEKSLGFFQEIVSKLQDATPEEREKITNSLAGIENDLNAQFDKLCENSGISREEIEKMITDPKNFDLKEWAMIEDFQKQLDKETQGEAFTKEKHKKIKKHKKSWITA